MFELPKTTRLALALTLAATPGAAQSASDTRTPIHSLPGAANASHVISSPGSYVLTENLSGSNGKHGILIQADDVTIDLAGFRMQGTVGSLAGISDGGSSSATRENIAVYHGHLIGWGTGISLGKTQYGIVEGVTSSGNGTGIHVGSDFLLDRFAASNNAGDGVLAEAGVSVLEGTMQANGDHGLRVLYDVDYSGSVVSDSLFEDNRVASGREGLVTRCEFRSATLGSTEPLLSPGNTSLVAGCRFSNAGSATTGRGLLTDHSTLAFDNEFDGFDAGILTAASNCWLRDNVFSHCLVAIDSSLGTNLITNNTSVSAISVSPFVFSSTCTYGVVLTPSLPFFSDYTPWANVAH